MGNIVFTNDEITAMVTPAINAISTIEGRVSAIEVETIGDRVSVMEANIDELYKMIEKLQLAIRPSTDEEIVKPKEKSDLEIFEQNDEIKVKNIFIDLDDVNKEKGFWELYDENWWNK